MTDKIIEKYIVDILTKEMNLETDHIWIWSQNRKLPDNAKGLYCTVGVINSRVVSAKSIMEDVEVEGGSESQEVQEIYEFCDVQIDLMSYDNQARDRRSEIIMALNSFYAQNLMEKEQFRIYEIPHNLVNMSHLFGGSQINVWSVVITCDILTRKKKDTDYYDKFRINTKEVPAEAGILVDNPTIEN